MEDLIKLKKELDLKIQNIFQDNQAYLDYLLQTKKNFLYRYLETTTDKNIEILNETEGQLSAHSFEENLGNAFKITDTFVKDGIKELAKSIPRHQNPKVKYSLVTKIEEISENHGKLIIESIINWDFPYFKIDSEKLKSKKVLFEYNDPNVFRKKLALAYEEACELFL